MNNSYNGPASIHLVVVDARGRHEAGRVRELPSKHVLQSMSATRPGDVIRAVFHASVRENNGVIRIAWARNQYDDNGDRVQISVTSPYDETGSDLLEEVFVDLAFGRSSESGWSCVIEPKAPAEPPKNHGVLFFKEGKALDKPEGGWPKEWMSISWGDGAYGI